MTSQMADEIHLHSTPVAVRSPFRVPLGYRSEHLAVLSPGFDCDNGAMGRVLDRIVDEVIQQHGGISLDGGQGVRSSWDTMDSKFALKQ